jgi:beta-phosphoglucomutase
MNLIGVLFDFDGVVLDSMKQHVTAWQYAFRKEGLNLPDLEIYLLEGRGVEALVNDICEKHKISKDIIPRIMEEKIKYYDQHLTINFFDGFFDLLEFLKSKNLKMAIVTGGSRDRILSFADQYLNGYFSGMVCAEDVVNTKPFPEPYIKGLEMLKLKPKQCIVIENAPLGIQSAKAAGIKTIAIETTLPKTYLHEADIIVQSFPEVQSAICEMLAK